VIDKRNLNIPFERRSRGLLNPAATILGERPLRIFQRGDGIAVPHQIQIHGWLTSQRVSEDGSRLNGG
jgi:hypothetical protein